MQTSSNKPLLCKFPSIGLFGQKRGDIFKFTIFVQKSVRIKKLAPFNKNGKLCKTKCSTVKSIKLGCARKERATFNLPILVFVVNDI